MRKLSISTQKEICNLKFSGKATNHWGAPSVFYIISPCNSNIKYRNSHFIKEAEIKLHWYVEGRDAIAYWRSALTCPRRPTAKYAKGLFQSCLTVLWNFQGIPPLGTSVRSLTVFSCLFLPILKWLNILPRAKTEKKLMLPNAEISIWKWNAWDKGRSQGTATAFINTILMVKSLVI